MLYLCQVRILDKPINSPRGCLAMQKRRVPHPALFSMLDFHQPAK
jgi:hypothetical protein